jgi:hypothetical protein
MYFSFSYLDFLAELEEGEEELKAEKRDRESDCLCQKSGNDGNNCICCLDFAVSETFDLGPSCVRMKYLSQEEGVSVNLTLGKTLAKHSVIKVEKSEEPICISMLAGLAKMCTKFGGLTKSATGGLIGCLSMQPKLFGETPVNFDFPCFDLNQEEIRMIETPKKPAEDKDKDKETEAESEDGEDADDSIAGFKVSDILNIVSKTTDQGIKLINDFLGVEDDKKPAVKPENSKANPDLKNSTKSQ